MVFLANQAAVDRLLAATGLEKVLYPPGKERPAARGRRAAAHAFGSGGARAARARGACRDRSATGTRNPARGAGCPGAGDR